MGLYTSNLIVNIDVNDPNCVNENLDLISTSKWRNSISKTKTIMGYGLTAFDFGFTNKMHDFLTLNDKSQKLKLKRVGFNVIDNPTKNDIRPYNSTISYENYDVTHEIDHLNLNGGYFNGFFKLDGYDYQVIPSRFKNGFTVENLLHINSESEGLFFTIGCRSEDKYNLSFSGEEDVTAHDNKPLDSLVDSWEYNEAFRRYESELKRDTKIQPENFDNLVYNIIGFGITKDKKLYYQYITEDGLKINQSIKSFEMDGRTLISIVYKPHYNIEDSDLLCYKRRMGFLYFFINGFMVWEINYFPEPIFRRIENDSSKQVGVPYTISWGGGSFGLKHSYHYDKFARFLYENQDESYINNNFSTDNSEIILEHDNTKFTFYNKETETEEPLDVIKVTNNGNIDNTLIKFNQPINVLANRPYFFNVKIYNDGFLKKIEEGSLFNKINLVVINNYDVEILDQEEYFYSLTSRNISSNENNWIDVNFAFKLKQNFESKDIEIGLFIESDKNFNINKPLYINNFTYEAADILEKDPNKGGLFIERNFDKPFIGGLEKMRIFDGALTSLEIKKNAESESPPIGVIKGGRLIYYSGILTTTPTTTTDEPT